MRDRLILTLAVAFVSCSTVPRSRPMRKRLRPTTGGIRGTTQAGTGGTQ
jgi:hypothetical protein